LTTIRRVQGDTNDTVTVTCGGVSTLAGASAVVAHVKKTTNPVGSATLTASVLDAAARTVLVALGSWITTATVGTWWLEVEVTAAWSDGFTGPRTFPAGGIQLHVDAALG